MNGRRHLVALTIAACAAGSLSACGRSRVHTPERPHDSTVALLPDPDDGVVGKAVVTNASGTADLAAARASTRVQNNQAPGTVTALSEGEAQALFGDLLATLPPKSHHFTLYFEFESDELTAESRALVPAVLRAVMDFPFPEVVVIGHTDTTGTPISNVELGLKRASTVRKLLVDAGLKASLVEVTSHGEADLLVPTADETFEPRNRRVEISVR
ncbi:MAG TPA: OmpA family protein [Vicinamibacterales bacterium]|jgi:outer membrane protein OmpA-like peptidoglycan-associated protein|nr:OmpA family protein [Vicinamibacterales bacterium]